MQIFSFWYVKGKVIADFEKLECISILRTNTKYMFEINKKIPTNVDNNMFLLIL